MINVPLALTLYVLPMYHFFDTYEVFNENLGARVIHTLLWPVIEACAVTLWVLGLFNDPDNRN